MKQRDIVAVILLLLGGSIVLFWSMSFVRRASFGADESLFVARHGLYGTERFPQQDVSYRWSKGTSLVQIPYPGNASVVSLLLAGGPGRTVPVMVHLDPTIIPDMSFLVAPEPRIYTLLLPPVPTERVSLQMTAPTMRDPRNGQKLGLVVSTISVHGTGYLHSRWVVAAWLALLAFYAVVRRAGGSPWLAAGIALAVLAAMLVWHVSVGWLYGISILLLGVQGGLIAAGWLASLVMKRNDLLVSVLLTVVSILIFGPVMAVQVYGSGDYMVHIREAARMFHTGTLGFPHFLFQLCLLDLYTLFPLGFDQVSVYAFYGVLPALVGSTGFYKQVSGLEAPAIITGVLLAWVTVVMIYRYVVYADIPMSSTDGTPLKESNRVYLASSVSGSTHTHTRADKLFVVVVVLLVMMATPITLFRWLGLDSLSYLGYIGTHAYHNPTFNVIKPIALVLFWFAMLPFSAEYVNRNEHKGQTTGQSDVPYFPNAGGRSNTVRIGATVALTVLSALAKPSYILCLIPALMLGTLYRLVRRQPVRWVLLFVGVMIPAGMMLVWQYMFTYASAGSVMKESSIILAPLKVMSAYSEWLLPKFVLSILFPVCVYVLYARHALASIPLNLAWLSFLVGACFAYGVSETGVRTMDGNFLWSSQIALFVLFVVSVAFVIRQYHVQHEGALYRILFADKRASVCLTVLGLHSMSGIDYYLRALGGNVW